MNLSFIMLLGVALFWMGGLPGVAVALMVAGSVLVHELGHALVARHLGVPIAGIELHFFGGAAQMAGMPRTPADEIAIAAAGPAVSLGLAAVGQGLAALTGVPLFALFATVNLVLGVFNLLPAFPSDGGRILRALLARRRGLIAATEIAVKVSKVVCGGLVATGVLTGSLQLVLVAAVLWMMGRAELRGVRFRGESDGWRGQAPRQMPAEYLPPASRWPSRPPVRRVVIWRS